MKVRDEVVLTDWVHAVIVPECFRNEMLPHIPGGLTDKVHFLGSAFLNIWEWSEKVYEYAKSV